MIRFGKSACLILLLVNQAVSTACAGESGNYISVISENDLYARAGQDRHYTNGLRIATGLDGSKKDAWYRFVDRIAGTAGTPGTRSYELALGHNIYTPQFFISPDPQPGDRPYAGWLYGELVTTVQSEGIEDSLGINLGIIGPAAQGEKLQKLNHKIIGDPEPMGWDYQLGNEPAVLIRYRRSWFLPLPDYGGVKTGLISRAGINLGNVFTDAGAGIVLRFGNYLPEHELPLRISPGLSGNNAFIPIRNGRFDWMVFTEIQGRGVARNIFLDGNTFKDSLSVDKKPFVWDASAGVILGFGQFRRPVFFSFSVVWRGREFYGQSGRDGFGSALIGIQH